MDVIKLRIIFESIYGIVDYENEDDSNPFKSVTQHQAFKYSAELTRQRRRVINSGVLEYTKMDCKTFFEQPIADYDDYLMIAHELAKEEKKAIDALNNPDDPEGEKEKTEE